MKRVMRSSDQQLQSCVTFLFLNVAPSLGSVNRTSVAHTDFIPPKSFILLPKMPFKLAVVYLNISGSSCAKLLIHIANIFICHLKSF